MNNVGELSMAHKATKYQLSLSKYSTGFAAVVEYLPQAVIIVDDSLEVQYTNAASSKFFGYPQDKILAISLSKLVDEKSSGRLARDIIYDLMFSKKTQSAKSKTAVLTIKRKNGTKQAVHVTFAQIPLENGDIDVLLRFDYIPTDEQKNIAEQIELELVNGGSTILRALNNIEDSVVIFDKQWRYIFVNTTGWRTLGKKKHEVLGHNVWELLPHLETTDFKRIAHASMKSQKKMEIEEYYQHRRKWYRTKFYPSKYSMLVQITDVTELKQTQEINNRLMGDLHDAMEVYWSEENRALRESRKTI